MRDVVFVWYVPYILSRKQQLVKALMVSAALVFFVDAVFFLALMLIPSVILAVTGFFLFRSWRYEYEYVYVNGDFTISKIIRKAKRKDVYHAYRTDFQEILPGRRTAEGLRARDFTSGRAKAPVYTVRCRGELVYIEAEEDFIGEMKKYYAIP